MLALLLPVLTAAQVAGPAGEAAVHVFDHENILGTSLHLEFHASESVAANAHQAVLDEIERWRRIASSYDPQSELSRLARPCPPTPVSSELEELFRSAARWQQLSGGAFQPGVEALKSLWSGTAPPDATALEPLLQKFRAPLWTLDERQHTVALATDLPLSFDAFAKGRIVDAALEKARAAGAKDIVLDIGGDLRTSGDARREVAVCDPSKPADNAPALCRLNLTNAAVATSGGYARGFDIAGRHYSHIFDPRSGRPVERVLQATVVAPDAATADALATILNVLEPAQSFELLAKQTGCAALIIDSKGDTHASPGWAALLSATLAKSSVTLPNGAQFMLEFELVAPGGTTAAGTDARRSPPEGRRGPPGERRGRGERGGGYRRPYVAAWIEDEAGKPVRTLCLWIEKPRWIADLRRWSRLYDGANERVAAVTRATRAAGKYQLEWDGLDDGGKPLEWNKGRWTLRLEVVREHGGYQYMSTAFQLGDKPLNLTLEGSGSEIGNATLQYRPSAK